MLKWLLIAALAATPAFAQNDPADGAPPDAAVQNAPAPPPTSQNFDSPYSAYEAGAWNKALEGFVDQQVEAPENPEVALNLGSVHYQMQNFEEADRAFQEASLSGNPSVRAQALYNLGNSAYRQGKLQEAVELFNAVLDLQPDDEDAKFNLEFVRDEIRRRHEEAQKRRQEQQQDQQQQDQEQDQEQQDQQQQDQQQQDQQQQDQQQQDQQEGQDGEQNSEQEGEPQDGDQDGLSDETERQGENPTDPNDSDSDDDGLPDGQEDQNRNGKVDPGETDPNKADTDGDGQSDFEEAMAEQQAQGGGEAQPAEPQEGLTPEEAERYLQALEEGLPLPKHQLPPGSRPAQPEKDW